MQCAPYDVAGDGPNTAVWVEFGKYGGNASMFYKDVDVQPTIDLIKNGASTWRGIKPISDIIFSPRAPFGPVVPIVPRPVIEHIINPYYDPSLFES